MVWIKKWAIQAKKSNILIPTIPPPSHRLTKEPTLIRVKLTLCKSMRFRSFKRSTVVFVDEIAPKLWAVKVGTLKKLLPFCQSQTTARWSGFDSLMTGSSLKCNRSHFSTLPAKIDLNKKWLPKQKTIQNFTSDAQGFRKTRNENPPTQEIGATS